MSTRGRATPSARELIRRLRLAPHREGGDYRETDRSADTVGSRAVATAIYDLLTPGTGDPVEMRQLGPGGGGREVVLGSSLVEGMEPQVSVPKGVWQVVALTPATRRRRP